jgi:hypothetical protein
LIVEQGVIEVNRLAQIGHRWLLAIRRSPLAGRDQPSC